MIGACNDRLSSGVVKYVSSSLSILPELYFNSGILLINIDEFRKCNIAEQCLELSVKNDFQFPDQDMLNITCYKKVKYLDSRWNAQWTTVVCENAFKENDKVIVESENNILDSYIIHYTTRFKPWRYPQYKFANIFWHVARETCFYEEILINNCK